MPSVFTKIIRGDIPAHIVFRDDSCIVFLSIEPLRKGHVLVVPVLEIDDWLDLPSDLVAHLMHIAQHVGSVQKQLFPCRKIALMIAGFEVPHVHIHLVPADDASDMSFSNARFQSSDELGLIAAALKHGIEQTRMAKG